jgi:5S rRNA maturation endonuclease (ribonuclease M5)/Fe2+ or Zn2+ uptake regulation protein
MHSKLSLGLKHILPKGTVDKKEFHVGNVRGDAGRSLVVQLTGPKTGMWHDLAEKKGGDIFSLWAAAKGLDVKRDFKAVFSSMCEWLGVPDRPSAVSPASSTQSMPTSISSKAQSSKRVLAGKWTYTDVEGNPITIVSRYDTDCGKEFFPYDVKTGQKHPPEPRPLYNLPGIKASQTVVLVEGEKAAQALIDAGICATTAMNGANAPIDKTDWLPLYKKELLIWPDNDEAGKKYAQLVADKLKKERMHSVSILQIPKDKPKKWDAADAVAESENIAALLQNKTFALPSIVTMYGTGHALDKTDPGPDDLVKSSILTPGGLCVIGGAPKTGKSDFLLAWLAHMSMGLEFLGMKTSRPLKIAYIQVEVRYHAICKRIQRTIQSMNVGSELVSLARQNLFFTPHMKITLDKNGIELMRRTILYHFDDAVDVIAIDPMRYVFDGGKHDRTENDNSAMKTFLQERIDVLRDSVNSEAANILVHHTKKVDLEQLEENGFQALSGASALHGYFSTGILMYRPDPTLPDRKLVFELRDGDEPIAPKYVRKINGSWREVEHASQRLINQEHGCKIDAENRRKKDVILELIRFEASKGNIYTMNQFCEAFSNCSSGLGSPETVRRKLNVLATDGYVRFLNDGCSNYDLADPTHGGHGYLCVENMKYIVTTLNKETGNTISHTHDVEPTHFKCRKSGKILPLEDKKTWQYFNEEKL